MKRHKEIEIDGYFIVPEDVSEYNLLQNLITFVEENNWEFCGGVKKAENDKEHEGK